MQVVVVIEIFYGIQMYKEECTDILPSRLLKEKYQRKKTVKLIVVYFLCSYYFLQLLYSVRSKLLSFVCAYVYVYIT